MKLPAYSALCFLTVCFSLWDCFADIGGVDSQLRTLQQRLSATLGADGEIVEVPLADVKRILENPPEIRDMLYMKVTTVQPHLFQTNYFRAARGSNGYFLSNGQSLFEATNMIYSGLIGGRFGSTNWAGGGGGGAVFSDGVSPSDKYFEKLSRMTDYPLALGMPAVAIGMVRFHGEIRFVAANHMDLKTNIIGRLITSDGKTASGIEYEINDARAAGWKYIVAFLRGHDRENKENEEATLDTTFPIRRWATYSVGPGQQHIMEQGAISYIELTTNAIPATHFNPTNWIPTAPVAAGLVISNELYAKVGGKLVSAESLRSSTLKLILSTHAEEMIKNPGVNTSAHVTDMYRTVLSILSPSEKYALRWFAFILVALIGAAVAMKMLRAKP